MNPNTEKLANSLIENGNTDILRDACSHILQHGINACRAEIEPGAASAVMTVVRQLCAAIEGPKELSLVLKKLFDVAEEKAEAAEREASSVNTLYCPHCGKEVEFDETEYDSEGGVEHWHCPTCGYSGVNELSAPEFVKYLELHDENGDDVDPKAIPPYAFTFKQAREDVIAYLSDQDEEYFDKRCCVKAKVLVDDDLIDRLAAEHLKCVTQFGNDRDWSVQNACDSDPGVGF